MATSGLARGGLQGDASCWKHLPASELEQCLLDDLGERWMDVENAGGDLVDCVPEAHRLDEWLDEDRGLRADDVGPEQQAGRGGGEDLHQTRRGLQRPAVGGIAVRAGRGDIVP